MPTHNRVGLLKKAVQSVLQQSYQNFKLVIVNDGSSDETLQYLNSLDDPRITYINHEVAKGACYSRNVAIAHLDTELVTGLDDDDVFLPHRLTDLLSVYKEKYGFVCSGYFWDYGAHKKALFKDNREISLSDAFDLNQCSNQILVNRQRIIEVGGFDENIPALQDHDLWVRLIAKYGTAYRIGNPSYIVNDDHSLERISSVRNKLHAIEMFEQKHDGLMSKRNKENFTFYKTKIKGDNFSLFNFIKSTRFGLIELKARQYLSQYFKTASKIRLRYLQTGSMSQGNLVNRILQTLVPLLATGGPGASRVILLSACIYFFGASDTSAFSGDFFIIMLLNTAFSQSYGFFLLKPEFSKSFMSITKQSMMGLGVSVIVGIILFRFGLISEIFYSLILLVILHFYYIYRLNNISQQYFLPLAIAELLISFLCLLLPLSLSAMSFTRSLVPYQIYIFASLIGLLTIIIFSRKETIKENSKVPFKNIRNISISTTASIFAIFVLPAAIKEIAAPEIVSIVALTISCMSISMLIPRTYANKIMKELAKTSLQCEDFHKIGAFYKKLMFISAAIGMLITIGYLYIIDPTFGSVAILAPIGICAILMSAQLGFVSLTYLSLQGADQQVAKMNLGVLLVTALFTMPIILGVFNMQFLLYVIVAVSVASFLLRNLLAMKEAHKFFNKNLQ